MTTAQLQQIQSQMIRYPSQDGTQIDAYMSRPTTPGRHPGVVVVMEAFGLVDHIKDVASRFAAQGYLALALDLYTREGSPDPSNMAEVLPKWISIHDSQATADLQGAVAYLKGQPDSNGKVGAIGFCSGGRYVFILACNSKDLNAGIDSAGSHIDTHGNVSQEGKPIVQDQLIPQRPVLPIDMVPNLSCPIMCTFGEEDPNPAPEHARHIGEVMQKYGKTYEEYIYPNAGHAFFADYRPSYRAAPAQDMWHRAMVFFEKYLKS